MALSYSLRYQKFNHYNRLLLEKEGEVLIRRQSFCLRGKGAHDVGENIYFNQVKDLFIRDDHLIFTTYHGERYILSEFAHLFESFLKDFLRIRNEYLVDNLFMKQGMLLHEYDGSVQVTTPGKSMNKGKSKIQIYEGSIVIVPETRECFSISPHFIKNHEYDEDEYTFKFELENGKIIYISNLGTAAEDFQQSVEDMLGTIYERIVNGLKNFFPAYDAGVLVKLASKLRGGRFIPFRSLKKIHEDLPNAIQELMQQQGTSMIGVMKALASLAQEEDFYISISVDKKRQAVEIEPRIWAVVAFPEKNTIIIGRLSQPDTAVLHCFRIIIDQGVPRERFVSKMLELEQTLLLFDFDLAPVYRQLRELQRTRYATAVKKFTFLRLLRKSYVGYISIRQDIALEQELEKVFLKAQKRLRDNHPQPRVAAVKPAVSPSPSASI